MADKLADARPPAVALRDVTRRFATPAGVQYTAIERLGFEVPGGLFVSLVGPSGCGKSTVLNLAAGLLEPTEGEVLMDGTPLRGVHPRAGYMFQQDALLPWKTVLENVTLGLEFRGRTDAAEAARRGREWLARVGLERFESHFPHQLSGGMRKRVTMAQHWIVDPDLLLMDEPFSALDVHTRHRMETLLLDLWAASRKTVLFVTHDLDEAISLSDRVLVLSAGPASTVVASYDVPLPRPRNLAELRTDPEYLAIYGQIWSDLRLQVKRSYERQD